MLLPEYSDGTEAQGGENAEPRVWHFFRRVQTTAELLHSRDDFIYLENNNETLVYIRK